MEAVSCYPGGIVIVAAIRPGRISGALMRESIFPPRLITYMPFNTKPGKECVVVVHVGPRAFILGTKGVACFDLRETTVMQGSLALLSTRKSRNGINSLIIRAILLDE
jgi:hypothetical protein